MKRAILVLLLLAGCDRDADMASRSISVAADNFQIKRRIVFYNGITGGYVLEIKGMCSLGNFDTGGKLTVTCKTGPGEYKKHYLGLSNNVTFFAEQIDPSPANLYQYEVTFRPSVILPSVDLK